MQRKLHPLEGIVAICALVLVLFVSVGFAQAQDVRKIALRSSSALVQHAGSGEVVYGKNTDVVVSIASITKLMTAMVVLDYGLDLDEEIVLSKEDAVRMKGSRSRLRTGLKLSRGELLLLSLMASDNRAAAALGHSYPGGLEAFVDAMNVKAALLDMEETRFVEPTGLSPANVSTASDLAKMVRAAHEYPLIREYSTKTRATVSASGRPLSYGNTNNLVRSKYWDIELSKTGYISEAGRCLVMQVRLADKDLIVVLLDSWGKQSRIGDANRIRKWLESGAPTGRSS
ncbi:MAG TPA: D-alanyl-D-alanine endopeptidase [Burkholderiales bacterium]|jgi:D-alanyl-D-alanine endopeptidase (penicillin-binding protein 7)|nr:D-alanyl-D-alanine endopeptidase [Burkholderiales bacterium]